MLYTLFGQGWNANSNQFQSRLDHQQAEQDEQKVWRSLWKDLSKLWGHFLNTKMIHLIPTLCDWIFKQRTQRYENVSKWKTFIWLILSVLNDAVANVMMLKKQGRAYSSIDVVVIGQRFI